MRTPPPVLPDRDPTPPPRSVGGGPDDALQAQALVFGIFVFFLTMAAGALVGAHGGSRMMSGLAGLVIPAALAGYGTYRGSLWLANSAGSVAKAYTLPDGDHTPYEEQFSHEESLAARGDVPGALAAYERVIAERPSAVLPRTRAAELYAARGGNPARAAELFREVRAIEGVARRDALYACSRLVDLYDGVLDEPGRALVELRRIIEQYPGTPVANHARDALPRMKARLLEAQRQAGRLE